MQTTFAQNLSYAEALASIGQQRLQHILPLLEQADPQHSISPQSRLLCASLSLLAQSCYQSLGGKLHSEQVGHAAALLSLLTKLDDQVIDGIDFHGKLNTAFEPTLQKVRDYLAPTLQSIQEARPANDEPRCFFAASLGQTLQQISAHPDRLYSLLALIEYGWEIQAQGVAWFASLPAPNQEDRILAITAEISGYWLLMITLIGTLPMDAERALEAHEEAAFLSWGQWIQSADAIADFEKDLLDGMGNSIAGHRLWLAQPSLFLDAYEKNDIPRLYKMLAQTQTDLSVLPHPSDLSSLQQDLQQIPQVAGLLAWIQRFLIQRYLQHPLCQHDPSHPSWAPYKADPHQDTHDPILQAYHSSQHALVTD
ncbi:MAG: hypothetical protein H6727_17320 [Myxococcales bacterium]|nr:hypothetical protein [Myxococcales bacterium]